MGSRGPPTALRGAHHASIAAAAEQQWHDSHIFAENPRAAWATTLTSLITLVITLVKLFSPERAEVKVVLLEPGHSSSTSGVAGPGPKSSPTSQHPRSMSLPRRPAPILRTEGEGHGHSHSGPHMWLLKAKNQHGYSYECSNCKRQYLQRWSEEEVDSPIQQRRCVVILDLSSSGADHVCLKKAGCVGRGGSKSVSRAVQG